MSRRAEINSVLFDKVIEDPAEVSLVEPWLLELARRIAKWDAGKAVEWPMPGYAQHLQGMYDLDESVEHFFYPIEKLYFLRGESFSFRYIPKDMELLAWRLHSYIMERSKVGIVYDAPGENIGLRAAEEFIAAQDELSVLYSREFGRELSVGITMGEHDMAVYGIPIERGWTPQSKKIGGYTHSTGWGVVSFRAQYRGLGKSSVYGRIVRALLGLDTQTIERRVNRPLGIYTLDAYFEGLRKGLS